MHRPRARRLTPPGSPAVVAVGLLQEVVRAPRAHQGGGGATGVASLVLNHLVPADPTRVNDGQWRSRAQRGFSGKVHVGQDLMRFAL